MHAKLKGIQTGVMHSVSGGFQFLELDFASSTWLSFLAETGTIPDVSSLGQFDPDWLCCGMVVQPVEPQF